MSILTITSGAIKELKKAQNNKNAVVRISIEGGGCSGFSYKLEFDDKENIDKTQDTVTEQEGLTIVIDRKSSLYLEGTILDWYEDISKRGFSFENPNATKSCGCGSSFSV